jgi:hypothetical protein
MCLDVKYRIKHGGVNEELWGTASSDGAGCGEASSGVVVDDKVSSHNVLNSNCLISRSITLDLAKSFIRVQVVRLEAGYKQLMSLLLL